MPQAPEAQVTPKSVYRPPLPEAGTPEGQTFGTPAGSADADIVLVVSHGAVPDPGGYFCAGMDAAAGQGSFDPARVIVVAPWYLGSGASTPPSATQLQWTTSAHQPLSGNWRD